MQELFAAYLLISVIFASLITIFDGNNQENHKMIFIISFLHPLLALALVVFLIYANIKQLHSLMKSV